MAYRAQVFVNSVKYSHPETSAWTGHRLSSILPIVLQLAPIESVADVLVKL